MKVLEMFSLNMVWVIFCGIEITLKMTQKSTLKIAIFLTLLFIKKKHSIGTWNKK